MPQAPPRHPPTPSRKCLKLSRAQPGPGRVSAPPQRTLETLDAASPAHTHRRDGGARRAPEVNRIEVKDGQDDEAIDACVTDRTASAAPYSDTDTGASDPAGQAAGSADAAALGALTPYRRRRFRIACR